MYVALRFALHRVGSVLIGAPRSCGSMRAGHNCKFIENLNMKEELCFIT